MEPDEFEESVVTAILTATPDLQRAVYRVSIESNHDPVACYCESIVIASVDGKTFLDYKRPNNRFTIGQYSPHRFE